MNILYLGPYRTESGWGVNSREYIECLVNTNNTVACKPVYMSNEGTNVQLSNKVLEAEDRIFESTPDIIIQHCLPDLFQKIDGCYNIGIFDTETYNTCKLWVDKINTLDEAWVDSKKETEALKNAGVQIKITTIHASLNTQLLENYKNVPELPVDFIQKDDYVFYFIGENNERKNILALVKAFHLAFGPEDKAKLVIKTTPGIKEQINDNRPYWRIRNEYIPEVFITSKLPIQDLIAVHKLGDCLVIPSRGESLCYPALEAMFFNKPVIINENIFPADLLKYATKVQSYPVSVDTKHPPLPHIYTAKELWYEIDVFALAKELRAAYYGHLVANTKQYIIEEFSRETITKRINEHFTKLSQQINKV